MQVESEDNCKVLHAMLEINHNDIFLWETWRSVGEGYAKWSSSTWWGQMKLMALWSSVLLRIVKYAPNLSNDECMWRRSSFGQNICMQMAFGSYNTNAGDDYDCACVTSVCSVNGFSSAANVMFSSCHCARNLSLKFRSCKYTFLWYIYRRQRIKSRNCDYRCHVCINISSYKNLVLDSFFTIFSLNRHGNQY